MFTCKKCNYLLDITKSITTNSENYLLINTADEFYKKYQNSLKSNTLLNEITNVGFTRDELVNYMNKKKLKDTKITKILLTKYDEIKKQHKINKFIFKCKNCSLEYQINNKQIITSLSLKKNKLTIDANTYTDIQKQNIINDNTLFRTKNYICPNDDCITNKSVSSSNAEAILESKEAIIFRPDPNTYNTYYLCVNCKTLY